MQVVVDRATERSEAGRKSPESGTWGGAQSFGVTESATVSPKVCAPGEINQRKTAGKLSLNQPDRIAAMMSVKPVTSGRARFVLVVSDLKPVLREGGRGAGLVANLTRPVIDGVSVLVIGIRLGLQFSKTDDKHVNANGELFLGIKRRTY